MGNEVERLDAFGRCAIKLIKGLPRPANKGEWVAVDIEMYKQELGRLHRPTGTFACISIAFENGDVYQVYDTTDLRKALNLIKEGQWILHNAMYDIRQLRRWVDIRPRPLWDTMLVELDLFGGLYSNFGLDDLSRRWLMTRMDKSIREMFSDREKMTPKMERYSGLDALSTLKIARKQEEYIKEQDESMEWYWEVDEPCIWAVLDMPPVRVDVEAWQMQVSKFDLQAEALEAGLGFNTKSPQQVMAIAKKMGWALRDTKHETLVAAQEEATSKKEKAFFDGIVLARRYRDASSKYGHGWLEDHVETGGLVYPSWRVTGAETGRMSCSDPNLMNIPVQEMPVYRTFFIPKDKKRQMMVSDVSQQEPRITAMFSGDERLLAAIHAGENIHLTVAKEIFGKSDLTKTKNPREYFVGKKINLGSTYGLTKYGLARQLHISEEEADRFLKQYFLRFRRVAQWMDGQRINGLRLGYVRTAMGRRIWINPYSYQAGNNCINGPIQGSAAEHTKLALVNNWRESNSRGLEFCVVGAIHDELLSDIPKSKKIEKLSTDAWMEAGRRVIQDVPIKIDVKIGASWGVKQDE
mgnify:FL=1